MTQGGTTYAYTYDGDGNRVKVSAGSAVTVYLGSLYEVNSTSGVTTTYYFLGSQRVAMRTASGVTWLAGDHLGSTSLATNAAGAKVSGERYYPYGATRSGSVPTDNQFTGQKHDGGTGLYYYGARYYDPVTGRFVSADTIVPSPGNPQALNRYSYTLNNPLRFTDPSGHAVACGYDEQGCGTNAVAVLSDLYGIDVLRDFGWRTGEVDFGTDAFWTGSSWTTGELVRVSQAAGDLAGVMGGAGKLKGRLGGVTMTRNAGGNGGLGGAHFVALGERFDAWTVVHELSHAWDFASWGMPSLGLLAHTGGGYSVYPDPRTGSHYHYGGTPPKGADANFNHLEDLAESVTTYVYPAIAQDVLARPEMAACRYTNYYELERALWLNATFGFGGTGHDRN